MSSKESSLSIVWKRQREKTALMCSMGFVIETKIQSSEKGDMSVTKMAHVNSERAFNWILGNQRRFKMLPLDAHFMHCIRITGRLIHFAQYFRSICMPCKENWGGVRWEVWLKLPALKSYDMQVSSFLLQRDVPSLSNFLVTFNDTEAFFTKWSNFYYGILKNLSWCQRERSCGLGMQRPEAPTWEREQSQLCLYTGQNQRWPIEISGAGTWDVNCQHAASGNVRLPWHCCWPHALKLRAAGDSKSADVYSVRECRIKFSHNRSYLICIMWQGCCSLNKIIPNLGPEQN